MNALRTEADTLHSENTELKAKIKILEQESLAKEQEITSLGHRNQVLETEYEKLEGSHKDLKASADQSSAHSSTAENLQRKVQVLEEEAEKTDRDLREANEKYVYTFPLVGQQIADS
jgi:tropomyosin, fungi type